MPIPTGYSLFKQCATCHSFGPDGKGKDFCFHFKTPVSLYAVCDFYAANVDLVCDKVEETAIAKWKSAES